MRIVLKESHLENLEGYLRRVSHPQLQEYGRHWSHEQVANMFKPSEETVKR
jgi:tripeptidyl-peptidase-1